MGSDSLTPGTISAPLTGVAVAHLIGLMIAVAAAAMMYFLLTDWMARYLSSRRYRRRHDDPQS